MGKLDEKVAIVTGAGRGIGRGIVEKLAARVANGLIANWFTEEAYEEYAGIVRQEAEAVGRNPDEVKLYSLTMMAGEDDASVEAMRCGLAFYFASPHYHHIADISGYGAQAKQVQAAWQYRDFAGASRLVTDAMVEKFAVMGSLAQRRNNLRWMIERKVYPILYSIPRPEHTIEDHFHVIELAPTLPGSRGHDWADYIVYPLPNQEYVREVAL